MYMVHLSNGILQSHHTSGTLFYTLKQESFSMHFKYLTLSCAFVLGCLLIQVISGCSEQLNIQGTLVFQIYRDIQYCKQPDVTVIYKILQVYIQNTTCIYSILQVYIGYYRYIQDITGIYIGYYRYIQDITSIYRILQVYIR